MQSVQCSTVQCCAVLCSVSVSCIHYSGSRSAIMIYSPSHPHTTTTCQLIHLCFSLYTCKHVWCTIYLHNLKGEDSEQGALLDTKKNFKLLLNKVNKLELSQSACILAPDSQIRKSQKQTLQFTVNKRVHKYFQTK